MKKCLAILLMALMLLGCAAAFADVESFSIAQIYQEAEDASRLHVRLESTGAVSGTAVPLSAERIAEATIGTGDTPVLSVKSVRDADFEGMSYVFVLDHAMPIGSSRVTELKTGMKNWIDAMGEKDVAAILVAEEDKVRTLAGFTADKQLLREAVDDYGKANEQGGKNMIYSAIREGILMASSNQSSRPRNCCIVVCSNGADTYQTLVTGEEIASLLTENTLPMYVVGYAYQAQKAALATLVNMAKNSGGWAEDATPSNDQGSIDEAFDRLRQRIAGGYDITLDCSDGFVFNGATLVSLRLSSPEVIVKRTADLYLLDKDEDKEKTSSSGKSGTQKEKSGQEASSAMTTEEMKEKAESFIGDTVDKVKDYLSGETEIAGKTLSNKLIAGAAAGILVVLVVLVKLIKRIGRASSSKREEREEDESEFETVKNRASSAVQPVTGYQQARPVQPVTGYQQARPQQPYGAQSEEEQTVCVRYGAGQNPAPRNANPYPQGGYAQGQRPQQAPAQMNRPQAAPQQARPQQPRPQQPQRPQQQSAQRQPQPAQQPRRRQPQEMEVEQTLREVARVDGTDVNRFVPQRGAQQSRIAKLTIRYIVPGKEEQQQTFSRPLEISIGRKVGNTLTIDYMCLSGRHALISCEGERVFISNVSEFKDGKQNEMYVSRRLVTGKTELTNGCRMNIGMIPMIVTWTLVGAAPQPLADLDMTVRRREDEDMTVRSKPEYLNVSWTLGGRTGSARVVMKGEVTIGRAENDTVSIPDPDKSVSKRHIVVSKREDSVIVANGSRKDPTEGRNPFYLDGQKVVDEVPFRNGMCLQAGDARITLTMEA